jgi:hypothetical protein
MSKETAKQITTEFAVIQEGNNSIDECLSRRCARLHLLKLIEILNHDLGHDATARGMALEFEDILKEV